MNEETYWTIALSLPGLGLAAATGYATGAGCYAPNMNCFSIYVPADSVSRALFATAALLPYAMPCYLPVAAAGFGLLRSRGPRVLERGLWLAAPLYAALLHAACVWFAGAVLPARRVTPTLRFDLAALTLGFGYVALALAMKPALASFIRRRRPRW